MRTEKSAPTHLPCHAGKIRSGRVAEPGERITCPACRKAYAWNLERARVMGAAALESAAGSPPPAYAGQAAMHSGLMATSAARHAHRILGFSL